MQSSQADAWNAHVRLWFNNARS